MSEHAIERRTTSCAFLLLIFPAVKPESVYFVSCPKQGLEMEAVVLHRVGFLEDVCPKQGQDFSGTPIPKHESSTPPGGGGGPKVLN